MPFKRSYVSIIYALSIERRKKNLNPRANDGKKKTFPQNFPEKVINLGSLASHFPSEAPDHRPIKFAFFKLRDFL